MQIKIDTEKRVFYMEKEGISQEFPLYSKESFELLSSLWLKVGWTQKYSYTFSWLGRPIVQLPEDMVRIQEVLYQIKPDVIIETGIAHGGSLIYYASLCKAMGRGKVIGVDIEIRPQNRKGIMSHELYPLITLIEGSSVAPNVVTQVHSLVKPNESVIIVLDSNHTKEHVLRELDSYHDLVSSGSYIIATDGVMRDLYDVPQGRPEWKLDNPTVAAEEFVKSHPNFTIEIPKWRFNESNLSKNITHWPSAWIKRIK